MFALRSDPDFLVLAIELLEEAVGLTADSGLDNDRHLYMFNLAGTLSQLSHVTGSKPELRRASAVLDSLVRARGDDEHRLAYVQCHVA